MPPATRKLAAGPCTGAASLAGCAVLCLLLLLAACSSGSGSDADQPTASPSSSAASPSAAPVPGDLVVELDRGEGAAPERYTLGCGNSVTGDLPDAAAACAHLAGLPDPFAALPADQVCTEQFGGPQTARVTGRWDGAEVSLDLARTNGCEIAQWDRLGPLLPGPVG